MADKENKLKVGNIRKASRYTGLSVTEFEDIQDAVSEALEEPTGTFARVSRSNYLKINTISKDVKSIKKDTLYLRKTLDDIKKNSLKGLDAGSGNGSGLGRLGIGAAMLRYLPKVAAALAVAWVGKEIYGDLSNFGNPNYKTGKTAQKNFEQGHPEFHYQH